MSSTLNPGRSGLLQKARKQKDVKICEWLQSKYRKTDGEVLQQREAQTINARHEGAERLASEFSCSAWHRTRAGKGGPRSNDNQPTRLALQPAKNAHIWAAATMELGALVCTSKNPICEQCPVIGQCNWRKNGYPKTDLVRKSQDWHGTDRKCRGTIVQALRENESLTENAIKKLWPDESQVEKALKTLIEDQLIQALPRRRYRLPQ